MSEENKAVVRRYFEEFHNQRNHDILEEIVAPDLLELTRGATNVLLTAFPEHRISIEEHVAEGDRFATVCKASGTHQGQACETEDRAHLRGAPRPVSLHSDQFYSLLVSPVLIVVGGFEYLEPEAYVCGLGI